MKSLFAEEVARTAPSPRFHIIHQRLGSQRSFSLYSYEQASEFGPERYAEEVSRAKSTLRIPVIASINCLTDEQWISYAILMEHAGADAVELNLSCPHGPHLMSGRDVPREMVETTRLVKENISIPVIPKLTPQMTDPLSISILLERAGADGLVIFNRATGLDVDIDTERPIMHGAYAGHGGPWAIHYSLRWISGISPHINTPISASGGVTTWEDVVKYLLVGANNVQVCTAIVLQGYDVIEQLNGGLHRYMEHKGYATLADLRGNATKSILGLYDVDRRHLVTAEVSDTCTGCDLCRRVCIYDAVGEGTPYAINSRCDGCGLCAQVCPSGSISMVPKLQ
jgi:dihydroorotate dehydrogenase (fumarate)